VLQLNKSNTILACFLQPLSEEKLRSLLDRSDMLTPNQQLVVNEATAMLSTTKSPKKGKAKKGTAADDEASFEVMSFGQDTAVAIA
jgi:hypothetical protein